MADGRPLAGKCALVTGGSQGMGFASAMELAKSGADILLVARRAEILVEAGEKIRNAAAVSVKTIQADVGEREAIREDIDQAIRQAGGVDILVNNAGGPPPGRIVELDEDDWERALRQNIMSVVLLSKTVLPEMMEKRWGRIVNISSTSAKEIIPGMVLSNLARGAVSGFAKTLSHEVGEYGITVNTICPGPTLTNRAKELIEARCRKDQVTKEQVIEKIVANVPAKRMAAPEEIGRAVRFLATDEAAYINGATITVDGGLTKSIC